MVFEAYLLLADIYFLDIINKFLLQAVAVIIFPAYIFFEQAGDAIPDLLNAERLQFDYFFLQLFNICDAGKQVCFQYLAFMLAVRVELPDGLKPYSLKTYPVDVAD